MERFQEGYVDGFEDLYRRYFARLYRFCLKRVGDPHEAEEVAQEAFVRAFRAMPQLEGERRFYPWLTVIASRLCVDAHRRRGRSVPSAEIDLGVIDGGQEDVVDAVDHQLVATAMTRLSERHREVLELREHRGWSYHRIAEHYGVSQGTIEALLFRARRALRREFLGLSEVDSRLAALPVIGWLLRKAHAAHDRAALWSSLGAGQLAGIAVPVAVAVSAAVVAVGGALDAPAPPSALRISSAAASNGVAQAFVETTTGSASRPAGPVGVPPVTVEPVEADPVRAYVDDTVTDSRDARRRAANDSIAADTGGDGVGIGVNTEQIVHDLTTVARNAVSVTLRGSTL